MSVAMILADREKKHFPCLIMNNFQITLRTIPHFDQKNKHENDNGYVSNQKKMQSFWRPIFEKIINVAVSGNLYCVNTVHTM